MITHISIVRKLGEYNKKFQNEDLETENQIGAAVTAKKHCYHYAKFADQLVDVFTVDEDLKNFLDLYQFKLPDNANVSQE